MKKLLFIPVFLWMSFSLLAQERQITGTVIEKNTGEGLPGVSILIRGTTTATQTDENGKFSLQSLKSGVIELEARMIGFTTEVVMVRDRGPVRITMSQDVKALDEVVVIGYATVKKRDLTGSVASVSGKEIAAAPVTNVAQAMQGKLPGVSVVSQDGRPDADIAIRVRGGGSISQSNEPLVLIDGIIGSLRDVPPDQVKSIDVLKDASSTAIYGARGANGVVLVTTKGPQAGKTTISYNSYAKFNRPVKYLEALGPYDYLRYVWANAAANGTAFREPFEKLYGIGAFPGNNAGGIESYRNMASDDMQRQVYNGSTSHNHDLTLTGGTDRTKIMFSTNYTNEQGMKLNSWAKRANVSFKLNQKVFENLTFDLDARFTDIRDFGDEASSNGAGSLLSYAYRFRPISTPHILGDLNALNVGNIEQFGKTSMWDANSPVARISDYDPLDFDQKIRSFAGVNWKILKDLTYHTDFSLNRMWGQRKYWSGAVYNDYVSGGVNQYSGNADYRKSDNWTMRWSNTLNYGFNVNNANKFNVLAGYELANSGGTGLIIQANRFPSNFDKETAFAQINQYDQARGSGIFSSGVDIPERVISYFGRANYSFLDRYLLALTFRADGSSRFSPEQRWAYFPAAAIAWRVSDEPFMKEINWLDDLKLRVSYGEAGNDRIPSGSWNETWTSEKDQRFQYAINQQHQGSYNQYSGGSKPVLANKDLKWETTVTRNLGVDFTLLNSRLSGTVETYWNTTKDLLILANIPSVFGPPTRYFNAGQTSNKGIEISLSGTIYKNEDWRINASGNINFNKGNVDKLASTETGLYGTGWAGTFSYPGNDYFLKEGSEVGLVRGFIYEGFYTPADFDYNAGKYTLKSGVPDIANFNTVHGLSPNDRPAGQGAYPGIPKFKDVDGNGKIDDNDISPIGNMNPLHTGGLNLNAGFKNVDLGLFFNWSFGNDIYNANKQASFYGPKEQGVYENKLAIMNDSYKIYDVVNGQLARLTTPEQLNAANANSTLPLSYQEIAPVSTLAIENGSFLRLNTLVLGYTLPPSLMSRARISSLRIYGSIYNAFTISGYSGLDPEVNASAKHNNAQFPTTGLDYGTYPRARSFVVGLNLTF